MIKIRVAFRLLLFFIYLFLCQGALRFLGCMCCFFLFFLYYRMCAYVYVGSRTRLTFCLKHYELVESRITSMSMEVLASCKKSTSR